MSELVLNMLRKTLFEHLTFLLVKVIKEKHRRFYVMRVEKLSEMEFIM